MEPPLTHDELHRIYYWLQRQRLMERRNMGEATLRDLEECEDRVRRLWLDSRPKVSHAS